MAILGFVDAGYGAEVDPRAAVAGLGEARSGSESCRRLPQADRPEPERPVSNGARCRRSAGGPQGDAFWRSTGSVFNGIAACGCCRVAMAALLETAHRQSLD